ncbi:aminotransferase class I/II-fold pyridoxal phosphate-dependent enzyme [Streptomyces sp. NPDC052396]|uniref:aminotransferase class I/II-fold pyridoxal phosphate-dependent enzyme n=1 Tax=Streptomyces sp. NPDC052396 TaxID=3365689 RepID=UPI0037D39336
MRTATGDAGHLANRAAIAAHHTAHGLPTVPGQVLVTTGATQAVALSARLYLGRGSTTVVKPPGWPGCLDVLRAAGSRPAGVELDSDGTRIDRLATALAEHRPTLLCLMPAHHKPTGTLMSAGRRRLGAEIAAEHGVTILEDSAHAAALAPERNRILRERPHHDPAAGRAASGPAPAGTVRRLRSMGPVASGHGRPDPRTGSAAPWRGGHPGRHNGCDRSP